MGHTPAKALMLMTAVLQTRKVKDSRELPNTVQDWEVKVSRASRSSAWAVLM
jgi:hypothetical protein